jgi:hypothetical protein
MTEKAAAITEKVEQQRAFSQSRLTVRVEVPRCAASSSNAKIDELRQFRIAHRKHRPIAGRRAR